MRRRYLDGALVSAPITTRLRPRLIEPEIPKPLSTMVSRIDWGGRWATAIMVRFAPADAASFRREGDTTIDANGYFLALAPVNVPDADLAATAVAILRDGLPAAGPSNDRARRQ